MTVVLSHMKNNKYHTSHFIKMMRYIYWEEWCDILIFVFFNFFNSWTIFFFPSKDKLINIIKKDTHQTQSSGFKIYRLHSLTKQQTSKLQSEPKNLNFLGMNTKSQHRKEDTNNFANIASLHKGSPEMRSSNF